MTLFRNLVLSLACVLAYPNVNLRAADDAPAGIDLIHGDATLVVSVADIPAFRKAIADSDFGQLWAEPDMQLFVKPAWTAALEQYAEQRKDAPVLPDFADIEKVASGGLALGVTFNAGGPPKISLAVKAGDAKAAERILAALLQGKPLTEGQVVSITPNPEKGPALVYEKGFVLLSDSPENLNAMRARLADPAKRADNFASAKSCTAARKLLGSDGHAIVFLDVPAVLKLLMAKEKPASVEKIKKALTSAGVDAAQSIAVKIGSRGSVIGMDLAIAVDGAPKGFFAAAAAAKPIPADALKIVPESAGFCSASRIDLVSVWKQVRELVAPEAGPEFDKELARAGDKLGMDIEKELLPLFGDTWVVYDVGGSEFMGFVPAMAVAAEVKDPAKAAKALDSALAAVQKLAAENPGATPPELREVKLGETRVRYLSLSMMPFSPAAAIEGNRLIVTFSVASMRRALKQLGAAKDITSTTGFKEALERVTGKPLDLKALPSQFSYSCPSGNAVSMQTVAQFGQMMVGAMTMEMKMKAAFGQPQTPAEQRMAGIVNKVDFALFPEDVVFTRHMKPAATVTYYTEGGLISRADLPVPSTGALGSGQGGIYTIPIIAAIAVPNLLRSRMAANESAAIAACKTYAEAQDIYRRTDWDEDGILEYAQTIKGSNSLYEKNEGKGDLTLVDAAFANAEVLTVLKPLEDKDLPEPKDEETQAFAKLLPKLSSDDFQERENATNDIVKLGAGVVKLLEKSAADTKDVEVRQRCKSIADGIRKELAKQKGATVTQAAGPKAGYYFKVLKGQGPHAPGGRKSYVVNGNMTLGYSLVAWPAKYDSTARNTFIINNTGTVYQKDLGEETQATCEAMTEYDPEEGWVVSE